MAVCFVGALSWAQAPASRGNVRKEATRRLQMVAKQLNLSPDQISKIKPLLTQQVQTTQAARAKFKASDGGEAAKQEALNTIQQSRASTREQVRSILTPDQAKQWDDIVQQWKDDAVVQGVGKKLGK
jgi:Spy/CpxP family protein refolding chaperone